MQLNNEELEIYEIYKKLATNREVNGVHAMEVLEKEFMKQRITLSRVEFKPFRDELRQIHAGYAVEEHNGKNEDGSVPNPNNQELTPVERKLQFIKQMYAIERNGDAGYVDPAIGRILDYEVPLKNVKQGANTEIEIGNIDLITETANKVYIINAKCQESNLPLSRSVFEVVTDFNMLSRRNFITDYNMAKRNNFKHYHVKEDIKPAILIFENSVAHNDLKNTSYNSLVGHLIDKYSIKIFIVKQQKEYGHYELVE